jgi:glycosyltransferase involved in cell wall biosynthesis
LYKNTLRSADFVIFLNQISASYIEDIDSSKYDIIPNFIENMECKSHIINKVVKTCIYTGGVIPEKGCDTIIEIAKKYPQISFRMCGIVNDSISSKHIPDNVVLLGHLSKEKIYSELKNADLFIFLSRFRGEGFSNSLLEAMALGLPCFVSDWASNRDMIEDKGGLVVPADDLNSILANFESMINLSPEKRQAMSDWNIYKVKEYYTEEIIVKRYKEIYEAIH